ncbi:MAG: pyruvate ferredoxin oxidoreductase [Thaumarchaeota archaeon]|nr:pyruvate ferredoxin oxidoreductase [Nitrososphaerota archaeon]
MPYRAIKQLPAEEYLAPGHDMCAGCTVPITVRLLTRIAGKNTVVVNATGCLEVSTTPYPRSAWKIPWLHLAFENAAAAGSGVSAAFKVLKRKGLTDKDVKVVVLGGDGGTADIGLQSLSGAFERGDDITYVCYDNEAYMNTGIQRSGTTPFGAWTTTTPPGLLSAGQRTWKKDLMGIVIAHRVKYAATASPSHIIDAANKIEKAFSKGGPAFIHFLQPCVPGWKIDPSLGVKIARLAVQSGLWPLYEYEDGSVRTTVQVAKRVPVVEYFKLQGRFKHLMNRPEELTLIQNYADGLAAKHGYGPLVPASQ